MSTKTGEASAPAKIALTQIRKLLFNLEVDKWSDDDWTTLNLLLAQIDSVSEFGDAFHLDITTVFPDYICSSGHGILNTNTITPDTITLFNTLMAGWTSTQPSSFSNIATNIGDMSDETAFKQQASGISMLLTKAATDLQSRFSDGSTINFFTQTVNTCFKDNHVPEWQSGMLITLTSCEQATSLITDLVPAIRWFDVNSIPDLGDSLIPKTWLLMCSALHGKDITRSNFLTISSKVPIRNDRLALKVESTDDEFQSAILDLAAHLTTLSLDDTTRLHYEIDLNTDDLIENMLAAVKTCSGIAAKNATSGKPPPSRTEVPQWDIVLPTQFHTLYEAFEPGKKDFVIDMLKVFKAAPPPFGLPDYVSNVDDDPTAQRELVQEHIKTFLDTLTKEETDRILKTVAESAASSSRGRKTILLHNLSRKRDRGPAPTVHRPSKVHNSDNSTLGLAAEIAKLNRNDHMTSNGRPEVQAQERDLVIAAETIDTNPVLQSRIEMIISDAAQPDALAGEITQRLLDCHIEVPQINSLMISSVRPSQIPPASGLQVLSASQGLTNRQAQNHISDNNYPPNKNRLSMLVYLDFTKQNGETITLNSFLQSRNSVVQTISIDQHGLLIWEAIGNMKKLFGIFWFFQPSADFDSLIERGQELRRTTHDLVTQGHDAITCDLVLSTFMKAVDNLIKRWGLAIDRARRNAFKYPTIGEIAAIEYDHLSFPTVMKSLDAELASGWHVIRVMAHATASDRVKNTSPASFTSGKTIPGVPKKHKAAAVLIDVRKTKQARPLTAPSSTDKKVSRSPNYVHTQNQ